MQEDGDTPSIHWAAWRSQNESIATWDFFGLPRLWTKIWHVCLRQQVGTSVYWPCGGWIWPREPEGKGAAFLIRDAEKLSPHNPYKKHARVIVEQAEALEGILSELIVGRCGARILLCPAAQVQLSEETLKLVFDSPAPAFPESAMIGNHGLDTPLCERLNADCLSLLFYDAVFVEIHARKTTPEELANNIVNAIKDEGLNPVKGPS